MSFSTVLIIAVVFGLLVGIGNAVATSGRKKKLSVGIASLPDFSPTYQFSGSDGMAGLAVDDHRHKICLIRTIGAAVTNKIVDYKEILSVELFEDGASVTKTSRSSQIGGALVGGLALGGVGAIIGGLSGKKITTGKVKSIQLRLIINDTRSPLHDVAFMNVEGNKGGLIYNAAMGQARHWHGLVEVLINRADAEERVKILATTNQAILPAPSIADEIQKLASLKDSGLLTLEEFQREKSRLLGGITNIATGA